MKRLGRLVPLIPPPRRHQVRYHGVLAPNASWRKEITSQAAGGARRSAPCRPRRTSGQPPTPRPRRVRAPKSDVAGVREGRTLTLEQLERLLESVREYYPGWYAEAYTTAWTGMRIGEIRALHWEDVRFTDGVIHVHRAISAGVLSTTKTGKGRDVALTSALREVLQVHRNQMVRDQHPALTSGLVFATSTGGVRGQNALGKVLRISAKAAGIPIRVGPQVLRRPFNTLLCLESVPPEVVRAQMGHTSQAMTDRYFQSDSTAIASAVESLQTKARRRGR